MKGNGDIRMPREMASAANLMVPPLAGAAAMSALGVGLVGQMWGAWMGALVGAADLSQRLFQPFDAAAWGKGNGLSKETGRIVGPGADQGGLASARGSKACAKPGTPAPHSFDASGAEVWGKEAQLMPEDFRSPKAIERPDRPDDLKAISGIGPKLEQVLNGLGIWTYDQIAGWRVEEIAWIEDYLGFKNRVVRDRWLEQAAALAETKTQQ